MLKKYFLSILLLLSFECLRAQNFSGRVVDMRIGEGVGAAAVTSGTASTTTGADGYFALQLEQFPAEVLIVAAGYGSRTLKLQKEDLNRIIELNPVSEMLSEVVVRSALIPKRLLETPASVSLLSREQLERADGSNFMSVLNFVPGIHMQQGALNTSKLSIRGIGARSQYSTNRVKAYFEGIPISTAEGETTLDDLDMGVIDRVEVIKGPNSSLYGAGLGGVIDIQAGLGTAYGSFGKLEAGMGSFDLQSSRIQVSHKSEGGEMFAAYNRLQTDSFRENGAYDRESFSVNGTLAASQGSRLSLFGNFTRLLAYIPSSISGDQMEEDPTSAAFTWKASQGYESYDKGLLGVAYEQQLGESLQNTTSVYVNFRDAYEPRPFDILKEDQMAAGARTKFNLSTEVLGLASDFSVGADFNQEWYDSATFENLYEESPGEGSVRGSHLSDNSQLRRYYNIFGQWNFLVTEALAIETGLNLNGTSYELLDLYDGDEVDQTGEYSFATIISPRIGAVYSLTPSKSLYASISHGFSTPTVAETLTPEGLINTSLKPETGVNYELGFKGNWLDNRLYSEVALYSVQVKDLLVAERVAEDQYIGRNAGKTDHHGVEIFLRSDLQLTEGLYLRPFFNAAFNFFKFEDFVDQDLDHSGNALPGVPDKTLNLGFDLISDIGISFYASYYHSGEIPLNDSNSAYSGTYDLVNLKASYQQNLLGRLGLELFAGLNNVFDETYASSILPNAVGFGGTSPRYFYPGNPRNWFGGVGLEIRL